MARLGPGLGLGGADEMAEEQRVRQRADATGDGRDRRGDPARRFEVDVAYELAVDDVDADVDHDRTGLEHVPGDEAGVAGSDDDDVGRPDVRREVGRP